MCVCVCVCVCCGSRQGQGRWRGGTGRYFDAAVERYLHGALEVAVLHFHDLAHLVKDRQDVVLL